MLDSEMLSSLLNMTKLAVSLVLNSFIQYVLEHTVIVQLLCPVFCPLLAQTVSSGRF